MRYDTFVAKVRERGEYADAAETEEVIQVVLGILATRLSPGEATDLAAQLPSPASAAMVPLDGGGESFGVQDFLRRIAVVSNATEAIAEWDAGAVLMTVAEAVSGGELNDVLTQLPSGYAPLFGKASLSG